MFEKSTMESYRQAKASEQLKERVVGNYINVVNIKKKHCYQGVAVFVACMILVFAGVAFESYQNVSIFFQGERLTKHPTIVAETEQMDLQDFDVMSMERSIPTSRYITLDIHADHEMTLTADAGNLQIISKDTDEVLFCGTEYTTSEDVTVEWYVDECRKAKFSVVSEKKKYDIFLTYQEEDGAWVIYQK